MHIFDSKYDKLVKIELDATDIRTQLLDISSEYPMYVCCGDYVVFLRFGEAMKTLKPETMDKKYNMSVHRVYTYKGTKLDVYLYSDELLITSVIQRYAWIIVLLLIVTLFLPIVIMSLIEKSMAVRIRTLEKAFSGNSEDKFQPIRLIE